MARALKVNMIKTMEQSLAVKGITYKKMEISMKGNLDGSFVGTITKANGDYMVGSFNNLNQLVGLGSIQYANGDKIEGEFSEQGKPFNIKRGLFHTETN
jgi:hypothetical protein